MSTSGSDPTAGDVYVADGNVVNRYTAASAAAGNATPDGQLTGFAYAWGVAVDPTSGDVYTTDLLNGLPGVVQKFDNTGASVPFALDPLVAGQIVQPSGLAIDPDTGHVFVGDLAGPTIYEFDASGADTGNRYVGPSVTQGIAIDSSALDGSVIVYAATGGSGTVRFTAPGVDSTTFAAGNGGGVAVALATQHVYVTGGNTAAEFDVDGVQVGPALGGGALGDSYGIGVDADASHLYISDNPSNSAFAFTRGVVPDTTTGDATDVEATTATLNGHVDPDGGPEVTCTFSYGTDPALAGADTVPCAGSPNAAPADVSADVSGLRPAQTYYYRLTSTNSFDGTSGEIKSFTTASAAPAAVTGAAADVTASHATLRGTLNPYGLQTSYHFEYGTSASYGSRVPAGIDLVAGNGRVEREIARGVSGLQSSTTYHYRLVATNSLGTTNGDDRTFTTDAAAAPVRGYEMVSPLDNGGVSVESLPVGVKARDDGNAVAYALLKAAYPDSPVAPVEPRLLGVRGGDGWSSVSLDAPSGMLIFPGAPTVFKVVIATSEDLSRTVVVSARALGGQGVEGNSNLYVYDVPTKHYTLVATSSGGELLKDLGDASGDQHYIGGSSDLGIFAFMSRASLTADAGTGGSFKNYVWSATTGLRFVSATTKIAINFKLPEAHQVSQDGARVYVDDGGVLSLYEHGQLTPISVVQRTGEPHAPVAGEFAGASPDGRYVLVISSELLTDDAARLSLDDALLYRYDVETGQLTFLAGGLALDGGFGRVMSSPNASGDGVYFTSLFPQAGATGNPLYLYRVGDPGVEFIAAFNDSVPDSTAFASPSRRYLAFAARARMTSYDNGGMSEIYLYDAAARELTCPSCRTDGGRSTGTAGMGQLSEFEGSEWQRYFAQSVTDDGQVFFDTPDPLVNADSNGLRDVYAYEDGRVSLISRGVAGREATFHDATPSGSDVFFVTEDRLVGQDDNVTADLYDARVGGGFAAQAAKGGRVACGGSECREPDVGSSGSPPTASERNDPASGKPGARAKARVSVVRSSFTSRALRLTVSVSGRGRIRVAGAGVVATARSVARAGRYTLKVPLTEKTRSSRRAGRRVRVVVRVSLTPPFAAPGSLKLTRTLGR